jgi:hypothetical protein
MDAVKTPFLNEIVRYIRCPLPLHAEVTHSQLGSWILILISFPLTFLVIHSIKETNYNDEKVGDLYILVLIVTLRFLTTRWYMSVTLKQINART